MAVGNVSIPLNAVYQIYESKCVSPKWSIWMDRYTLRAFNHNSVFINIRQAIKRFGRTGDKTDTIYVRFNVD